MNIPLLTPELIEAFILVFIRVSAMIFMVPIFGERRVPFMVTWGLSLLIAALLFPIVGKQAAPSVDLDFLSLALRIGGEVAIGVIIGFAARFIFAGIQVAGELTGVQMGFSIANVIDPASNQQVSIITEFQYMLALLLFLTVDAHHIFIAAIAESYQAVPPLSFHFSGELLQTLIHLSKDLFIIAIKISAPIMAVLLFTNVGMGVIARTVPQMNIFIVSFPLQIAIGLLFLGLTAPVFVELAQRFFLGLAGETSMLLRLMQS